MLGEIETRLQDQVLALKLVEGAAALSALKKAPATGKQPAAYVVPVSGRGEPNRSYPIHDQRATRRFGIVLVLGNLKDIRGETANAQMETLATDVTNSLIGWSPKAGYEPCEYASDRVLKFDNGIVWWLFEYTTATHLRKV